MRWRSDGAIEFLGRIDQQVKVRGFRVEPGEIESVLARHPGVKDAVVLLREDHPGEKRLVAYVAAASGHGLEVAELRDHVKAALPEYMVPSALVVLDSLPLNANGKVDRQALPAPDRQTPPDASFVPPRNELEARIAAVWREVLHLDTVGVADNFFDLGGHSLALLRVHGRLREEISHVDLKIVDLFEHPTIGALAGHLATPGREARSPVGGAPGPGAASRDFIAVIGMAGRFPGAADVDELWRNLRDGKESIAFFSREELEAEGIPAELCGHPRYVRARGVLAGADLFDASFFGYSAREAEIMDPQQRVFLETAWAALEAAGYAGLKQRARIGVFAGTSMNTYLLRLAARPEVVAAGGGFPALIASDKDFLATRVSYKLNLGGPSIGVQTACSTSLVAVHLACQSLLGGECDMALAGGVSISVPQKAGYLYQEEGILSPDGHCRAFDRRAQGCVGGSGVGVVVLKRLRDALADGDAIDAVIRGSAVNNDGAMKVGYTAPGVEGQAEVIRTAQAAAGVGPEEISYVEAHGTGTALGDPIEVQALRQVFGRDPRRTGACAIGSLKTNIGHLDAAAGVAGLIKTVLALKHRQVPPSLHFQQPNPGIDLASGPFRVSERLSEWRTDGAPRRAGVSSFGIGGTNAHVVLEEAPSLPGEASPRPRQLLVLSARTPAALEASTRNLARHLERNPQLELADVAFTLQVGRGSFRHRRAVVCRDLAEAARALGGAEPGRLIEGAVDGRGRELAFLFPGQGAQHPDMGRELYRVEPAFRAEVDRCADRLRRELGFDLRDALFPAAGGGGEARTLDDTAVAQPALFVVEYALARLWMGRGVIPQALLGHSVGEYVAACLAGVFSLEDALSLVAARGRLMQELPAGAMLAVALDEPDVRPLLEGSLGVAAANGPAQCVVSGSHGDVEALEGRLRTRGVESRRLRTSHAFHSSMMAPAVERLRERVAAVERHAPRVPFVSNVTGTWVTAAQATDPGYWAQQLRETVRFGEGLARVLERSDVLLEVGPGRTLCGLARRHPDCRPEVAVVASARHARENLLDDQSVLEAVARLWLAGVDVDFPALHDGERRRRVALPQYPFDRQRFWLDAPGAPRGKAAVARSEGGKKPDVADWFYRPTWRSSAPPFDRSPDGWDGGSSWLVFADSCGLGTRMVERLRSRGARVATVVPGPRFERRHEGAYAVRPAEVADYEALADDLAEGGGLPSRIVHLWGVTIRESPPPTLEHHLDHGFYSLLFLAQALGSRGADREIALTIVTTGLAEVSGEGRLDPEKATVLGPCRVIPQEYPGLSCRNLDVRVPVEGTWLDEEIDWLLAECNDRAGEAMVAYRGRERWVQALEAVHLPAREPRRLRDRGVYLITGGLGGIGLELAGFLADAVRARLVLVGRSPLPARGDWDAWVDRAGEADPTSRKLKKLAALEARGAEVLVIRADVADRREMRDALARAESRFGAIHGVIHAAGVAPGGVIQLKTREMAEGVLLPKVAGTLALLEILGDCRPDFVVLCSSLASVLGVPGQSDYCAANAFQDAVARSRAHGDGPFILSLNWDAWLEVGMATGRGTRPVLSEGRRLAAGGGGIQTREGTEAFARALHQPFPQILVSTEDLAPRLARHRALHEVPPVAAVLEAPARHPRPALAVPYVAPRDEVEQAVADIWQDLLGFEPVGIEDDFFDLGGHSLLAMQVVNRIRQTFGLPLRLQALFDAPTVAELSRVIVGQEARPGEAREIARITREVARLPGDEVERLLQEEGAAGGNA